MDVTDKPGIHNLIWIDVEVILADIYLVHGFDLPLVDTKVELPYVVCISIDEDILVYRVICHDSIVKVDDSCNVNNDKVSELVKTWLPKP